MSLSRRRMMGLAQNTNVLGSQPIGTTLKIKIGDTYLDFIVVHQGNPDPNMYDPSCNGTWLMMKLLYSKEMWGKNDSYLDSYANYYFKTLLPSVEEKVRNAAKAVKIPYADAQGVYTGANGCDCTMFLPSCCELGWASDYKEFMPEDGACLDYFKDFEDIDSRRITTLLDGSYYWYWTRSPRTDKDNSAWAVVSVNGDCTSWSGKTSYGFRPIMIFPKDTPMDIFY